MILFQKPFSQKLTAFILIVCLVGLITGPILLYPGKVRAQCPVQVIADVPKTATFGSETAWEALKSAWRSASLGQMTLTAAKLIWEKGKQLMEWALGVLLNLLLHQLLSMITNDIVNWVQGGGTPRFLSMSLDDYLWEAFDKAGGAFVEQYLGAGWLCEPFDLDIKLALLEVPTFKEEVKCSLLDIVANINDFYDDFSAGGWKGWIELSKPQNNFYGALLLAQAEKTSVEGIAKAELEKDVDMGEGFLSPKDCTWYDANNNVVEEQKDVWGTPRLPAKCECLTPDYATGRCYGSDPSITLPCHKKCKINTPSSIVNEMTKKATTNFYDQMNAQISAATAKAGPYQVYVQAIVNALINRVMQEGLLLVTGEPVPPYGAPGAGAGLPKIADPQSVLASIDNATTLEINLNSLKENENNKLQEQQTNLTVLKLIPPAYEDIIPILDQIMTACTSTPPYTSYIAWAQNHKDNINNNLIPSFNNNISNLEAEIAETIQIINDINTALVSIQDFIDKANAWLTIYQQVNGDQSDPGLQAAETAMNTAENKVITDTQQVLIKINGAVYATDIPGLSQEVYDTIIVVVTQVVELQKARGDPSWPASGTLYGELEAAQDLKDEAIIRLNECLTYVP